MMSTNGHTTRKLNFGPGPAQLPLEVGFEFEIFSKEELHFQGLGKCSSGIFGLQWNRIEYNGYDVTVYSAEMIREFVFRAQPSIGSVWKSYCRC